MKQMNIPSKIKSFIDNKPYTFDDIGMSGNQVLLFEDMVLKIEEKTEAVERQNRRHFAKVDLRGRSSC